jgi:alpha-L-rhamnosidase
LIAEAAPVFRRISLQPLWFPDIGKVAANYGSCVGTISTQIDGDASGISSLELTVPPNCIAEVELPAHFDWFEGARKISANPEIIETWKDSDTVRIEVGSGSYHFTR